MDILGTLSEPAADQQSPPSRRRSRRLLSGLGTLAVVVLVLQLPLRLWVAEPLAIDTTSMTPTIRPGDRVLEWRLGKEGRDWRHGDIVVVRRGGESLVKRIVAVGGETVGLRDGRLIVDGAHVDEPWTDPIDIDGIFFGPVEVPVGTVFVMGDDRIVSQDSRDFGPVPVDEIAGLVVGLVWPLARAGGLEGGTS